MYYERIFPKPAGENPIRENSKKIVYDYISKNVYNELMKKYDELSRWLETKD